MPPPVSSRKTPNERYTPPPPSSFIDFLFSPLTFARQVATSPRTHVNLAKLTLLGVLALASLIISLAGYGIFWFSWGRVTAWSSNVQLYYGTPNSPPHSLVTIPSSVSFTKNQAYDVYIDLTLPVTKANSELGNFMIHLSLLPTAEGTSKSSGDKPIASLHSATYPTLAPSLPLLSPSALLSLVFYQPRATISLRMLEGVVLAPSWKPKEVVKHARIWVGREDLWKSLDIEGNRKFGREVATLGCRIRFEGRLTGVRAILAYHPILSLIASTTVSLLTTLFFSTVVFFLFLPASPPSSKAVTSASAAPSDKFAAPRVAINRGGRTGAWASDIARGMAEITGEEAGGDSSAGERVKREEEELEFAEEAEWERLRIAEAEREKVKQEEEDAAESSGEDTIAGERAVDIKREADEDDRSLLGGSGTTLSRRSWGPSISRTSASSSSSTKPPR